MYSILISPRSAAVLSIFSICFGVLLFAAVARADATPAITSFSVTPSSINNHYTIAYTWNENDSTGNDLLVQCPVGVTLQNTDGSTFPCNSRAPISAASSGSVAFIVINVSGTSRTISATIYPKDASGTDYDAGAMSTSFTVATAAQPITVFSVSTTTLASGASATLTWTGIDIPAANIQFECSNGVQIMSTSPAITGALPCGTPAFTTDQSGSGSITFTATNGTYFPISVTAHVLPAVSTGQYDETHALSTTFLVNGFVTTPDPSVTSFTSSQVQIVSGVPFKLSWNTLNATSTDIQFSCADSLTFLSVVGTTTTSLPCGAPAFAMPLGASGSTTVEILNAGYVYQNIPVTLLPQTSTGTYLARTAQTVQLNVLPKDVAFSSVQAPLATQTAASSTNSATTTPAVGTHFTFTHVLGFGSKNSDVTNLQTFLAQNSTIYPEGLVTGYFGPATLRAVERLQVKYNLASAGGAGYGNVGPKTRALLNSLQTP